MQTGLELADGNAEDEIDVTIAKGASSVTTVSGNLTVTKNLTVQGTTTTVNSTTTTIADPIFTLGGSSAPESDDNKDRGIEFHYHDGSSARLGFFGWDDSATGFTAFSAASNSSEVFSGTVMNCTFGVGTFSSLDVSGNADIDGTMEADAYTVNGTALDEFISDTVGAMVGSNTETGISVTYQDGDNTIDFALSAAQTTITSLLATDIKIGEDDQTKIDFETADEIHFYAANVEQVYLADNIFGPQSDSDVDLGSSSVRWKDAYVDSITVTGEIDGASLDISGNADIDGTLEADAITINGSAILAQATTSAVGCVELATTAEALAGSDSSRAVTPEGLAARSYSESIGDGSATAIAVDHNLNTRDVIVQLYDVSSYDTVIADVVRTTVDRVTITFASAPSSNDIRVLVTKID
jgi:cytoskeletal protein CcmA (bactofilin family)